MSEVKRFFTALGFDPEPYVDMIEDTDGTYVYYEDYETLRAKLAEAQKQAYPAYKREKALRCKAEAANADLQRKLNVAVRLEADSDATFDWNVLGKIDDLERENDELRERLKPVEKVCKKWDKKGDRELLHRPRLLAQELWQAIKAACEEKDLTTPVTNI